MADFSSTLFGGGGPNNFAKLATQSEAKRQGIIDLGMKQINAIYGGGTAPFYSLVDRPAYTNKEWNAGGKNNTYYTLNKKGEFAPFYADPNNLTSSQQGLAVGGMLGGGAGAAAGSSIGALVGGDIKKSLISGLTGPLDFITGLFGSKPLSPVQQVNKRLGQGLLFNAPVNQSFEGFQPDFFDKRAQAYTNYALPQLADQYQSTRASQLYGLANRGLGDSSVATKASSDLEKTTGAAKQQIADTGIAQANDLQKQVEDSRQNAINQLYQTSDPASATRSALESASQFQQPGVFAPLTDMFAGLAKQYYTSKILNTYGGGYGGSNTPTAQDPNLSAALGNVTY